MDKKETSASSSSFLDNIALEEEELTVEKVRELLEEGKQIAKGFAESLYKPTTRGNYTLGDGLRGEQIDKACKLCDEKNNIIEKVYKLQILKPDFETFGQRQHKAWVFSNYRCSNCRIVYDFR